MRLVFSNDPFTNGFGVDRHRKQLSVDANSEITGQYSDLHQDGCAVRIYIFFQLEFSSEGGGASQGALWGSVCIVGKAGTDPLLAALLFERQCVEALFRFRGMRRVDRAGDSAG